MINVYLLLNRRIIQLKQIGFNNKALMKHFTIIETAESVSKETRTLFLCEKKS